MEHPVISVLDTTDVEGTGRTVVWHLQTAPDAPAGMLTGAWLFGFTEENQADRVEELLRGTVIVPVGETTVPDGTYTQTSVAELIEGVGKQLADIKQAVRQAQEANPKLTQPRFDAPGEPDVEKLAESYRGEPIAKNAWVTAKAVADIIETWHAIEGQRRSRKYLQDVLGQEVRPLPVPQL